MSFNPDPTKPTEEIIFSRKFHQQEHPPPFFQCDVIYHIPEIESLVVSSSLLSYWMGEMERIQYQAAAAVT